MRRFFISPELIEGATLMLRGSEAHHIIQVLRLKPGHRIELFDGRGTVYSAVISGFEHHGVRLHLLDHRLESNGADPQLILGLGLLKGKKMELVIQKATELGVHRFVPLVTSYCEKRGRAQSFQPPMKRWQRIVLEACKQSRRSILMEISPLMSFSEFVHRSFSRKILFCEQRPGTVLDDIVSGASGKVALLIGPAGGWSAEEIHDAEMAGFQCVSLGKNILRAETAALAAVAITGFLLRGSL